MKRIGLVALLLSLSLPALSYAHPPKAVALHFDPETHLLTVDVTHDVKDASTHFIHLITVEVNGQKLVTQEFRSQADLLHQPATYLIIDAQPGDEIKVTAECSISGKKSETIKVQKAKPSQEKREENR